MGFNISVMRPRHELTQVICVQVLLAHCHLDCPVICQIGPANVRDSHRIVSSVLLDELIRKSCTGVDTDFCYIRIAFPTRPGGKRALTLYFSTVTTRGEAQILPSGDSCIS